MIANVIDEDKINVNKRSKTMKASQNKPNSSLVTSHYEDVTAAEMAFLDKEMPSSKDYLRHIGFNVQLSSLFKVLDHKFTNATQNFCPVLLKI